MKKAILFMTAVLILVFGIGMTAKAASLKDGKQGISGEQYQIMEEEYLKEVRLILLEKGCKNAGVTLTYVKDVEENREYTIAVHHSGLDKMEEQEIILLEARLQESANKILMTDVCLRRW